MTSREQEEQEFEQFLAELARDNAYQTLVRALDDALTRAGVRPGDYEARVASRAPGSHYWDRRSVEADPPAEPDELVRETRKAMEAERRSQSLSREIAPQKQPRASKARFASRGTYVVVADWNAKEVGRASTLAEAKRIAASESQSWGRKHVRWHETGFSDRPTEYASDDSDCFIFLLTAEHPVARFKGQSFSL